MRGTIRLGRGYATKVDFNPPSHQRLNVGHPDGFQSWLQGLTDGDGTLWFGESKKQTQEFCFKIRLGNYNIKLLRYLKKKLRCGTITPRGETISCFRIRNPEILRTFVLPLLEKELITVQKRWDFVCMKEALDIYSNLALSLDFRNKCLREIRRKRKQMPQSFKDSTLKIQQTNKPKFGWIIGFTEREGSFYLTKKSQYRIVHGFGYTQNFEKALLELTSEVMGWKINVKLHINNKQWILNTTSSKNVEKALKQFNKKFKGIKALEFAIWKKRYTKYKGNYVKLLEIQSKICQKRAVGFADGRKNALPNLETQSISFNYLSLKN